ncbi:MAG: hypothetical protein ABL866_00765 [Devosia sp.]
MGKAIIRLTPETVVSEGREEYETSWQGSSFTSGPAIAYTMIEGTDLANIAAAMNLAVSAARNIPDQQPEIPPDDQWIEIADDKGNIVRTLPFRLVRSSS